MPTNSHHGYNQYHENHEVAGHKKTSGQPGRMTMTPGRHIGAAGTVIVPKRAAKPYVFQTNKHVNPGGKKIV